MNKLTKYFSIALTVFVAASFGFAVAAHADGATSTATTNTNTNATTTVATSSDTTSATSTATSTITIGAGTVTQLPGDSCNVTAGDIATIKAIQANPNLSYDQELEQELAARKALIGRVLDCAEAQVDVFHGVLASSSATGVIAVSLQLQLNGSLNDATAYYELERSQLAGAGIYGTEEIAKNVLSWRGSVFVPLADQINNFVLWTQNQALFAAASSRMTQVGQVVSFLSSTNDQDLANAYAAAQSSFENAQNKNAAALGALAQSQATNQVNAAIQQSLASLAAAYQNLFTVSGIIQTLVPGTAGSQ